MTGWRIGYAAGPRGIIERMTKVQEYLNSCINTSAQQAAAYALDHPGLTEELLASFRERRTISLEGMDAIPGSAFGECGEGFIRVSYTTEKEKLIEALARLKQFCAKYR